MILGLGLMSFLSLGWATKGGFTTDRGFMHYVYVRLKVVIGSLIFMLKDLQTFPPVAISMLFVGLWTWTDIEIRRLQVCYHIYFIMITSLNRGCFSLMLISHKAIPLHSAACYSITLVASELHHSTRS